MDEKTFSQEAVNQLLAQHKRSLQQRVADLEFEVARLKAERAWVKNTLWGDS